MQTTSFMSQSQGSFTFQVLADKSVWIGLGIRILLAWILPLLLDDGQWIPGVAYTDIDYHVFTDAAAYIQQGQSPYKRTTYRYTPFLAQLLATSHKEFGRFLFCIADAFCGYLIAQYRQRQRQSIGQHLDGHQKNDETKERFIDALWWLYNPLAINICTRGSAESFMVLLPVLVTVWLVRWSNYFAAQEQSQSKRAFLALLAGICHGIAVHSKLYPIIYSLSYVIALSDIPRSTTTTGSHTIQIWIKAIVKPAPMIFGLAAATAFCGTTVLGIHFYGMQALEEGLIYHFSRVDHRHNYSMHWYWIYLARAATIAQETSSQLIPWIGRVLLVPQLVLLVSSSFVLAAHDLSLALFVQTFAFVAFNKVVTAQYFTWYLCLLPLCSHLFMLTSATLRAVVGLLLSVLVWLGSAYLLEMQGLEVFRLVWVASVLFFLAEVNLLVALLRSVKLRQIGDLSDKKEE